MADWWNEVEPGGWMLAVDAEIDRLPDPIPAVLVRDDDIPDFLVEGLLLDREFGVLFGEGGTFKTTLALALAAAVASGGTILGRVVRRGPVLYVSEEDPASVLRNRLEAIASGHGRDVERVLANVHFLACQGATLDSEEWRDHIEGCTERLGAVFVVFDPYAELTRAAENSNDEAKPNIHFLRRLTRLGATVLVVHHAGKARDGVRSIDRLRGASAMYSAGRFAYLVKQQSATRIALQCVKMSRARRPAELSLDVEVTSTAESATAWARASFRPLDRAAADPLAAELIVLETLAETPRMISTALREAVVARGVSPPDASTAIKRLQSASRIAWSQGKGNTKHWALTESGAERLRSLRSDPTQTTQARPASPASRGDAGFGTPPSEPASPPIGGAGRSEPDADLRADLDRDLEERPGAEGAA